MSTDIHKSPARPRRFAVGDRVQVIASLYSGCPRGTQATIERERPGPGRREAPLYELADWSGYIFWPRELAKVGKG